MNIEIANRLVELRKKSGLSQEQLADKLGLSRQAVSKWERAEASPDTDNLICLAKIYNVSLDELLNTDEPVEDIARSVKEKNEEEKASGTSTAKEEDKTISETSAEDNKEAEETKNNQEAENNTSKHMSFNNGGIHIVKSNGDEIHIDKNGINIKKEGKNSAFTDLDDDDEDDDDDDKDDDDNDEVRISPSGIVVTENGKKTLKIRKKSKKYKLITGTLDAVLFAAALTVYLVISFLHPEFWKSLWIVFLVPFVIMSIPEAILKRRFSKFNISFLVTGIYMILGFYLNLWHPGWIVFFAIPLYYIIVSPIDTYLKSKYGDDDDDD